MLPQWVLTLRGSACLTGLWEERGGRDHGGNASLFGALPGLGSVEHKDWEGMMLSACD